MIMAYKVTVWTTHECNEIICELLFDLGASGVCVNDPKDFDDIDRNGVVFDYIDNDDRLGAVTVEGFFDYVSKELFALLKNGLDKIKSEMPCDAGSLEFKSEEVVPVDWLEEWKKYYKPIDFDKIAVYPSWIEPCKDKPYISIEPGSAFGSGEHESTRMCMSLLLDEDLKGKKIADVGCGSGILGMAALKLGAENVYFCDLDKDAIENLKVNLALNKFDNKAYQVKCASLLDGFDGKVDVIFANITADILIMLAPSAKDHLKDKGLIIISGVIKQREEDVLSAYQKCGFKLIKSEQDKDWRAYSFEVE